ncbi:hypothetical protein [Phaeobacter piscinae]|uniref:hypothetical protein n=1 Tax=Phaeobacter piscinae TaxID=1580596 RepID=UPI000F47D2F0|nr:hypothetical protein [Phaeobacter piscinae]
MARKRKKTAKNPIHAVIRRTGGSPSAVSQVFKSTTETTFQRVLEWSFPRYKSKIFFCGLAPELPSQLAKWMIFPFDSPSEALAWLSAMSGFKKEEIRQYNIFIDAVEKLGDRYEEIYEKSENLNSSVMLTYSGLSTLLFALSKSQGLEAQRNWMVENLYVANGSLANVLFYFFGLAGEGGRDPEDILGTMYTNLLVHIDDSEFASLIRYLLFDPPVDTKDFTRIAQLMANQPIVDQYELGANFICSNYFMLAGSDDRNLSSFWNSMVAACDWRATGISILRGDVEVKHVFLPLSDRNSENFFQDRLEAQRGADFNEREFRTSLANDFFCLKSSPGAYLASSAYLLKSANSIDEYQRGLARREIVQAYRTHKTPAEAGRRKVRLNFESLRDELDKLQSDLERREVFRLVCLCGIEERRLFDVLICLYEITQVDRAAYTYFPTNLFFERFGEDEIIEASTDLRIPISISRIERDLYDKDESVLYLSVERVLEEFEVLKPSELTAEPGEISHFLFEACTLECLRQSLEFVSKSEVEEERIDVLRQLAEVDPDSRDKYEEEAQRIIGRQTVDELLQRYEVGKIHCDEKAILAWAKEELAAKFIRLQDFIAEDLLPVERDAELEFLSHISSGKEGAFTFKVPSSEALSIANSITTDLARKYALDPRHGIDSYLSLGMRHGELEEHLRAPLSNRQLLTVRGPTGYEETDFWCRTYHPEVGIKIGQVLARFSEKYNETLKKIKDEKIQVNRDEKPDGIIDLEWQQVETLSFSSTFSKVGSIESLLEEFSSFYWATVEQKLAPARTKVITEIGPILHDLLDELKKEVEAETGVLKLGPFTDELTRARSDLDAALKELASWHNVARSTDSEPISLVDIISAAQRIVTRLHPRFRPDINLTGDINVSLTSSLHTLIEVFKALFFNVFEHSGVDTPQIFVQIDATVINQLIVNFSSSIDDIETAEGAAAEANERIRTGEYEARLPKEGGSGLPKVARATVKDGKPNTVISVDSDRSLFCVQMNFNLLHL